MGLKKKKQQTDDKPDNGTSSSNFAKYVKALDHGLQILYMKGGITLFHCFLNARIHTKR